MDEHATRTEQTDPRDPTASSLGAAVVIGVIVLGTYGLAISQGRWPPGHPWSGISLTTLVVSLVLNGRAGVPSAAQLVVATLALCSGIAWLVSA